MRKKHPIDMLFPRTRQGILAATLLTPERWWYLSDLAKHLGVPPSSLQRELHNLEQACILRRRREGNRVYYQADSGCPFLPELQGILVKTAGLADVIREALAPLADRIRCAFVHGSIARGEEVSTSDVDLLVVGDVGLSELAPALRPAEQRLKRNIGASVYRPQELARKAKVGHHFVRTVLDSEKLFILGDRYELAAIAARKPRPATPDQPAGT